MLDAGPRHRSSRLHRRVVVTGLARPRSRRRRLDVLPAPEGYDGDWHTADCADVDAVMAVFAEAGPLDGVVHLAGIATSRPCPTR